MNNSITNMSRSGSWLKEKSNSEKHYMILAAIFGILALSLLIALSLVIHKKLEGDVSNICLTPGCIHAATNALSRMDSTVNPCDDFYQFACGTFKKETLIPEDKYSVGTFSTIADKVQEQVKHVISEIGSDVSKPYALLKKTYDLCMNTTAIEIEGLKTIKRLLKEIGGWPLLDGALWNEVSFDWKTSVYKFRKYDFNHNYFISFSIGSDDKNSTRRVISLGEPSLGISREYLINGFNDTLIKAYYEYMVDVAVIFGANKVAAEKELKDSLQFEMELAKLCLPREEKRNSSLLYNPMTIEDLQIRYPFLNWLEYIKNVFDIPSIEIKYDERVIVSSPKYLENLEELLRKTPKRVLANYVMRRAVLSSIFFLTEELRSKQTKFMQAISGQSDRKARWKECTNYASGNMFLSSGALYARKYFNIEVKHHVEEMVEDILEEFTEILKNVEWMDENTRKNALAKADSIVAYIGYPEELLDEEKIEKYYAGFDDLSDNFLLSSTQFGLFFTEIYYKKLRIPVNKTDWIDHAFPTIVNAFYSSNENSIQFPAGILQGVFYSDDRPRYMNYGAIGYVIGHEVTHGFDDQGRQFDKDGNLDDWWDEETQENFIKKAQCIIDQYGNFTMEETGQNLNGINTQGENIADNGGIIEAYKAYLKWVDRNSREKQLPGLPYTPEQMFWISAAQTWCSKNRPEALKIQVTTGYHSPERFRVNAPLGNMKHFGDDFNCPLGSAMNPKHKCKVW